MSEKTKIPTSPVIDKIYDPGNSLEFATRPDINVDLLFDMIPGYEGVQKQPGSPIYATNEGEAVAFRLGPLTEKDTSSLNLSDTSNGGSWKNGPPSSFGQGIALVSDPRMIGPHLFSRRRVKDKTIYAVGLGRAPSELEYGVSSDRELGIRTLGAVAANLSAGMPMEFPYLQGWAVDKAQKGSRDSVIVFNEKLYPRLSKRRIAPSSSGRWLLAKGAAADNLKIVGQLKNQ